MSIPTNQLVYAGLWDSTARYPQYWFVLSPIDSQCYVNVNIQPITGGSDPSVQPSAYWVLLPQPSSTFPPAYGSFSADQSYSLIQGVPFSVPFTTANVSAVGITTTAFPTSDLTITNAGVYKVTISVQPLVAPSSGIAFYPSLSSVPVPNSSVTVQNIGGIISVSSAWILEISAGDVLSFIFNTFVVNNTLEAYTIPAIPLVPSIRTTILRIA
jgi:hypothetical protein